MAEHARITPAGPSSSGTRRPREDTPSIPPRTRTVLRQEYNIVEEEKLPWHDDIDRKTTLAHRKLISQLLTKERQLAESEEHLERGLQDIIEAFEKSCVDVMIQVRKHEIAIIMEDISKLLLQHELEITRRIEQLTAENILSEHTWYDHTGFKAKLDDDGRKTRFLAFQANARKEEKRREFAAKKAAEQIDQTLEDPALAELRKTVKNLEKKVTKSKKPEQPKKAQKPSETRKPKETDKAKPKRSGSKNGSGPGKTGRRGPEKAASKSKSPAGASRRH